jgi:hypothetical protein
MKWCALPGGVKVKSSERQLDAYALTDTNRLITDLSERT